MAIRMVKKVDLEARPYEAWNAFVDLISMESYDDLTDIQRIAHLSFWYDSEVNNGGHLQYFENHGCKYLKETINALNKIGSQEQVVILEQAGSKYLSKRRKKIKSVLEFVKIARKNEFGKFDEEYYRCNSAINDMLEEYLKKNIGEFISII